MSNLRIESVLISSLSFDTTNARRHDAKNLASIEGSLRLFGQRKPIVVTGANVVVAGNGTLEAAKSLGWSEISVVRIPNDWTAEQVKAYALADNRTAELAEWDAKVLADQLIELDAVGWDVAEFGFEPIEPLVDSDDEPLDFSSENKRSQLGDIWVVGNHRIACGDSTDIELLDRLLDGNVPDLIFCDPPYGIKYKAMRGSKDIANDENEIAANQITKDALALVIKNQPLFICCDWRSLNTMIEVMKSLAREPKSCIVWDKQSRVQNLDKFAKQHEFILYSGPFGGEKTFATDVWQFKRDFNPNHPTPKPTALVAFAIQSSSSQGDLVFDCFAGSGSTLVAAEKTKRKSVGIELDPQYVDVILDRLEKETGLEATRLEQ